MSESSSIKDYIIDSCQEEVSKKYDIKHKQNANTENQKDNIKNEKHKEQITESTNSNSICIDEEEENSNEKLDSYILIKETEKIYINYSIELFQTSLKLDNEIYPNFLNKHKLTKELRQKMANWLLEVVTSYEYSTKTYLTAVKLIDQYLSQTEKVVKNEDIHLLGSVCMFIASKMEEINPLTFITIIFGLMTMKNTSIWKICLIRKMQDLFMNMPGSMSQRLTKIAL